ncbi:MAG: hypothetical protein WDO15_21370 [Bacteroidota bacterium]
MQDNEPANMEMKPQSDDSTTQMMTMSEGTNIAVKKGFTESFKIAGKGLTAGDETKFYSPEDVRIDNFFRFEGYSDPNDNAILYLIETNDGTKGTLIDAYGTYADAKLSKFIKEVEDIQKKIKK